MNEKERPFLTATGYNTDLVHFPPPYHFIVSATCRGVHLKQFCMHGTLCTKYESL